MQITPRSYVLDRSHATIAPAPTDSPTHQQQTLEAKADPIKPNSYSVGHIVKATQPDEPLKHTAPDPNLDKPSHTFLSIALYSEQIPLVDTFA